MRIAIVIASMVAVAPALAFERPDGLGAVPVRPEGAGRPLSVDPRAARSEPELHAWARASQAALRRSAPRRSDLGDGDAVIRFHVRPDGRISDAAVVSATSPAHGEAARRLVLAARLPPPPGRKTMYLSQSFRFH